MMCTSQNIDTALVKPEPLRKHTCNAKNKLKNKGIMDIFKGTVVGRIMCSI